MVHKIRVKLENEPTIWKFMIEPDWKKIKDLEKYLKNVFNLDQIFLVDGDGNLHPNSSINYVHCMSENNEVLTIRTISYDSNVSEKRSAKRKKLESRDHLSTTNADISHNIDNIDSILNKIMSTIKSPTDKKKHQTANDQKNDNDVDLTSSCNKITPTKCDQNVEDDSTDDEILFKKSKKRKRRKKKSEQTKKFQETLDVNILGENEMKSDKSNQKKIDEQNRNSKHFHFDESGELIIDSKNEKGLEATKVNFVDLCPDNARVLKPLQDLPSRQKTPESTLQINGEVITVHVEIEENKDVIEHNGIKETGETQTNDMEINSKIENDLINSNSVQNDNRENFLLNDSEINMIGPQIPPEFLIKKIVEKENLEPECDIHSQTENETKMEVDQSDLIEKENKILVISDVIIANGSNKIT